MPGGKGMAVEIAVAGQEVRRGSEVRRGFLAMLPLWAGVVPFALAFALLARTAGFSALETQGLSLLVFAGGAQIAIVTLYAGGAGAVAIVLTVLVLNLRHVLYGLSLSRQLGRRTRPPLSLLAFMLTDEAYGVTVREGLDGRGGPGFFLGASLSLYGVFNLATLAGVLVGRLLPDPQRLGLDFIFPLTFLALLLPLLRNWRQGVVAASSAIAALLLSRVTAGGVTILLAAITAAGLGVALDRIGTRPTERA
jgi:4-azaleucine resistance transporter AzlC